MWRILQTKDPMQEQKECACELPMFVKGLEATPGFEPGMRALQAPALPLGYAALCCWWCPRPDLNRYKHNVRGILSPLRLPISPPGQTLTCKRKMERETRFELATPTLARLCSTTELFPRCKKRRKYIRSFLKCKDNRALFKSFYFKV